MNVEITKTLPNNIKENDIVGKPVYGIDNKTVVGKAIEATKLYNEDKKNIWKIIYKIENGDIVDALNLGVRKF